MDSLLANYASSDEEEAPPHQQPPPNQKQEKQKAEEDEEIQDFLSTPTSKSSKFSLPPPKSYASSSPFSLPPPKFLHPKQQYPEDEQDELLRVGDRSKSKSSSLFTSLPQPKSSPSLFSSLPPPKTHVSDPETLSNPLSDSASKRVVQFRPPVNPGSMKLSNLDEEEDEDEGEKERKRKKAESALQTSSVKSFLSSIPAPKNSTSLGALPSGSGTGRRSIIDADVPASNLGSETAGSDVGVSGSAGYNKSQYIDGATMNSMEGVGGPSEYEAGGDYSNWGAGSENSVNYDGYGGYGPGESSVDYSNLNSADGDYASYESEHGKYSSNYESNWKDGTGATVAPEVPVSAESAFRLPAKRGRKDAPPEIIEVNQEELMKNRPREDQVRMTGIAFGPSYQPASTKGKPSKLHKRKHQIGSLYFDMKQKEMELAERRAKGFLTKAQTQGKYGW